MYLNSTNQADSRDPVKKTFVDSNTMFIFSYYHENIVDIGGIVDCHCLNFLFIKKPHTHWNKQYQTG
jgi:hypothetical protein